LRRTPEAGLLRSAQQLLARLLEILIRLELTLDAAQKPEEPVTESLPTSGKVILNEPRHLPWGRGLLARVPFGLPLAAVSARLPRVSGIFGRCNDLVIPIPPVRQGGHLLLGVLSPDAARDRMLRTLSGSQVSL